MCACAELGPPDRCGRAPSACAHERGGPGSSVYCCKPRVLVVWAAAPAGLPLPCWPPFAGPSAPSRQLAGGPSLTPPQIEISIYEDRCSSGSSSSGSSSGSGSSGGGGGAGAR